jgi:hypothetical protein
MKNDSIDPIDPLMVIIALMAILALVFFAPTPNLSSNDKTLNYLTDEWKTNALPTDLPYTTDSLVVVRNNTEINLGIWRQVANDPRTVRVSTIGNTENYVITITDGNGESAQLWTDEKGNVRTVTLGPSYNK